MAQYATAEGTGRYKRRFEGRVADGSFRSCMGLHTSSIGLGTYLGNHDALTDRLYGEAITRALQLGCNVLDTAINYRCQRSERVIGEVLSDLFQKGELRREEVIVATKGGFVPFDGFPPSDPTAYFLETYIRSGVVQPEELVADCHCLSPRYLQDQVERSLKNLRLSCIDIYYLHNPETQLEEVSREEFHRRMRMAFEVLEQAADRGKIRMYGTATWNGYRRPPEAQEYLSLETLVRLAKEVAGDRHRFRMIQLPYNLAMPEAFAVQNQPVDRKLVSLLEAAGRFGIYIMTSASILQSRLARNLPPVLKGHLPNLWTDAQRAIQFVRSTPGVGTALVGMKQVAHVEENLRAAEVPPASSDEIRRLFSRPSAS